MSSFGPPPGPLRPPPFDDLTIPRPLRVFFYSGPVRMVDHLVPLPSRCVRNESFRAHLPFSAFCFPSPFPIFSLSRWACQERTLDLRIGGFFPAPGVPALRKQLPSFLAWTTFSRLSTACSLSRGLVCRRRACPPLVAFSFRGLVLLF